MPVLHWISSFLEVTSVESYKMQLLPVLLFFVLHQIYISKYHFSQLFRTSFNIIRKKISVESFNVFTRTPPSTHPPPSLTYSPHPTPFVPHSLISQGIPAPQTPNPSVSQHFWVLVLGCKLFCPIYTEIDYWDFECCSRLDFPFFPIMKEIKNWSFLN